MSGSYDVQRMAHKNDGIFDGFTKPSLERFEAASIKSEKKTIINHFSTH